MATLTLTAKTTPGDPLITAGVKEAYYTLTMGTTYSTGGHVASVQAYLKNEVYGMEFLSGLAATACSVKLMYVRGTSGNPSTGKICAYYHGSGSNQQLIEVSASRNLSTIQGIVKFIGR